MQAASQRSGPGRAVLAVAAAYWLVLSAVLTGLAGAPAAAADALAALCATHDPVPPAAGDAPARDHGDLCRLACLAGGLAAGAPAPVPAPALRTSWSAALALPAPERPSRRAAALLPLGARAPPRPA